jgi:hypothetical protein
MDPTCTAREVTGRLVTEAAIGTSQDRPRRLELLCGGGQRSPRSSSRAETASAERSHHQLGDHRPASEGQPAAAHRPTSARQLPAGVPASGERPGRQTGLSSSRGVHLIPRPAQHHARRGPGGLPLQGLRNLTFGFEQDHPAHERVAAEHQGADGVPRADGTEPARIVVTLVRAGSARHREPLDLGGHQRSQRTPKNRRSCGIHRTTSDGEAARTRGSSPPARLPRALRALAHEAVVTEDEPHHRVKVESTAQPDLGPILGGRATSVPFTAVLTGLERTTTDNHEASSTCAISHPHR